MVKLLIEVVKLEGHQSASYTVAKLGAKGATTASHCATIPHHVCARVKISSTPTLF
jgi:hypothetical protein